MEMHPLNKVLSVMAVACFISTGCSTQISDEAPPAMKLSGSKTGGSKSEHTNYFLAKREYADIKVTLPEPPKADSALFANDIAVYRETRKLKGTKLWEDARINADKSPDNMCRYFSKPAGIELSKEKTPWTYYLIGKISGDASRSAKEAKKYYQRKRPFVYFNERTCSTLEDDKEHIDSGSFPSSHSAYGELVGLILTELIPSRQNEIISAAHQFGYYRVVCGFHWASDIESGRQLAAYVNAELHANSEFMHALQMAKKELSAK